MTEPDVHDPSDDALAAELALGVLVGAEKAHALGLQLSDLIFAQKVGAWQNRLAPLYADFEEIPAPESIWNATVAWIGATPIGAMSENREKPGNRIWKPLAIATSLLAASLAAVLIVSRAPSPPPVVSATPLAVASLTGGNATQLVTVAYEKSAGKLRIAATGLQRKERVPELWLIPGDGRPRSLGLIRAEGTTQLSMSESNRALIASGTTLAVTMEKLVGAPHEAPGSTPVLTGKVAFL